MNIPPSSSICTVRVIETTTTLHCAPSFILDQDYKGYKDLKLPSYSFLISNGSRHLLWDLGIRKDWENMAPKVLETVKKMGALNIDKDTAQILDEDETVGIKSKDIEAVIWSHHHFDHQGNVSLFPHSTNLIVGPGFKKEYLPFYPTNPDSNNLESDIEGRELQEVDFTTDGKGLQIGDCAAIDYFDDGSFYLLDTPGHTPTHICALARVTCSPDTFVLMGGDAAHHAGEIRPSKWQPLPKTIKPCPISRLGSGGCPGEIFENIHYKQSSTEPFFTTKASFQSNAEEAERSVRKLEAFDADENVLVIIAHDASLRDSVLEFYPKTINDWKAKDVDAQVRWRFCKDLEGALE